TDRTTPTWTRPTCPRSWLIPRRSRPPGVRRRRHAFNNRPGRRRSFQRRVLAWYAAHGRDLPWRRTRDPYAILVSEVLSHQTQIARVLPVYERLLGRYPTVTALASAPLAEVKAITDPLGYKIRGRWLHTAALRVADRPGGTFPDTLNELRSLPGIGRYTAGAVMSFAHHRDAPVLDTNVARLLRRY